MKYKVTIYWKDRTASSFLIVPKEHTIDMLRNIDSCILSNYPGQTAMRAISVVK